MPTAFLLGAIVILSPWAIRNQFQFGRPIVTTTHGGYTLLLANNPEFYQWLRSGRWGSVWQADRFNAAWERRKPAGELAADRLAYAEAWQTIRVEPATFADACLVRLGRLWSPLPHQIAADESLRGRLVALGRGRLVRARILPLAVVGIVQMVISVPGTRAGARGLPVGCGACCWSRA